jgi:hypothetical protein
MNVLIIIKFSMAKPCKYANGVFNGLLTEKICDCPVCLARCCTTTDNGKFGHEKWSSSTNPDETVQIVYHCDHMYEIFTSQGVSDNFKRLYANGILPTSTCYLFQS